MNAPLVSGLLVKTQRDRLRFHKILPFAFGERIGVRKLGARHAVPLHLLGKITETLSHCEILRSKIMAISYVAEFENLPLVFITLRRLAMTEKAEATYNYASRRHILTG
ncbi:hypothetical protein CEE36_05085 [candidate division TA06 bacterium B3_TA06]|uniref:Uncharacterized protein n=1 Tax=candidate division TA06 bacterium B3_TA06 TaxID=2012487 RepID=A0A532V7E5_UNCT6|nr:MAG: hypothetical protein CEE36_05085 [candidate division TA06 bacterium B3_TA06]